MKTPLRGSATAEMSTAAATGPRPMRSDAARNVERLVAVAREAFALHGPNASLDDIARKAGVGPGTLYRHFPTRLALLEAVYRDVVDQLCAEGDRLLKTRPPADAFGAWLQRFVGYVGEKQGLAAALTSEEIKERAVFAECRGRIFDTGGRLFEAAKAAGAIKPEADLGDVFKLVSAIARAGEGSPEGAELSGRLLDLAMDGLRAGTPARGMASGALGA